MAWLLGDGDIANAESAWRFKVPGDGFSAGDWDEFSVPSNPWARGDWARELVRLAFLVLWSTRDGPPAKALELHGGDGGGEVRGEGEEGI